MRWVLPIVLSLVLLSSTQGRAESLEMGAEWDSSEASGPREAAQPVYSWRPKAEQKPRSLRDARQLQWYGWQIVASDLVTLGLAFKTENLGVLVTGYLFAPPIIHIAHKDGLRALGSVGLRVGTPLLFVSAFAERGDLDSVITSAIGGAVFASVVDAGVLGWKRSVPQGHRDVPETHAASAPVQRAWVQPTLQPSPHGLSAGLVGGF